MSGFPALEALGRRCGYLDVVASVAYDHVPYAGGFVLEYIAGDVETLVHELCHWALATPDERGLPNLGMVGYEVAGVGGGAPEPLVFWLEGRAYAAAGVEWVLSEEVDGGWRETPAYRSLTEEVVRSHPRWAWVPEWFPGALADALRSDVGSG